MDTTEIEPRIGRAGLKLPGDFVELARQPLDEYSVVDFFHTLWELNDLDPSTEHPYDGQTYKPRPYSHELVLPAETNKALVVVRGSFQLRDKNDIDYEKRRDSERSSHNRLGVTYGTEEHAILMPPDELGQFVPQLSTRLNHVSGGSHTPKAEVNWQGQFISEHSFEPEVDTAEIPVPEYWRQKRQMMSRFLGDMLLETLDFLS